MAGQEFCNGKRVYDKKGAITAKNRRWEEAHIALRVYECPGNYHWHLTSEDPYRHERQRNRKGRVRALR